MDDDADLIARLLTLAGTIMEDTSIVAIVDDGTRSIEQRAAEIATAAADIESLARAVEVIHAEHFDPISAIPRGFSASRNQTLVQNLLSRLVQP